MDRGTIMYTNAVEKRFALTREEFGCQRIMDRYPMAEAPEVVLRDTIQGTLCQVRQHIWSLPQEPINVYMPSSWWEHFKQDNFPEWLLNKFPVTKKKIAIIERKLLYPAFHFADPAIAWCTVIELSNYNKHN